MFNIMLNTITLGLIDNNVTNLNHQINQIIIVYITILNNT